MLIRRFISWRAFQSTLPHGSDDDIKLDCETEYNFNPRSLTGATDSLQLLHHGFAYFNPRSLTGATLCLIRQQCQRTAISIHAPSRERLISGILYNNLWLISIHAPSRERRQCFTAFYTAHAFQSTLPHGSDSLPLEVKSLGGYFNPRSLTGATRRQASLQADSLLFQSTLPHGSDQLLCVG